MSAFDGRALLLLLAIVAVVVWGRSRPRHYGRRDLEAYRVVGIDKRGRFIVGVAWTREKAWASFREQGGLNEHATTERIPGDSLRAGQLPWHRR